MDEGLFDPSAAVVVLAYAGPLRSVRDASALVERQVLGMVGSVSHYCNAFRFEEVVEFGHGVVAVIPFCLDCGKGRPPIEVSHADPAPGTDS